MPARASLHSKLHTTNPRLHFHYTSKVLQQWKPSIHSLPPRFCMSMAYHPQTDDQTGVLNRVFEQHLCSFVHDQPNHWYKFLSLVEWSYNTFVHASTGFTPFEVTYNKPSPSLPLYLQGSSTVEAIDSLLTSKVLHEYGLPPPD